MKAASAGHNINNRKVTLIMNNGFVLAIDGPAGAGKSTIAKLAAGKLGFAYIDTGAMYRAVTWKLLQTGEPFTPKLAGKLASEICITFRPENAVNRVFVDGTEVTDAIRTAEVTGLVSKVAAVPEVRFPDAQCKIFLTATVEERARRRGLELEAKGETVDYKKLQEEIASRDKQDMEREVSPLRQAEDAIYLDTSAMNIEQVTDKVLELVKEKQL